MDRLVSKGLILITLFLLGFSRGTFRAYVALATFPTVLVHANVRLGLGPLGWVSPRPPPPLSPQR